MSSAGACSAGSHSTEVRRQSEYRKEEPMTGIQFITDSNGRKTAAVIDLKKHRALWEDIEDVIVSRSRRRERRVPLEGAKASLVASGKLRS
jgi:hypothetical protein